MGKKVIWSITALEQLEEIHSYILEETKSHNIAAKVVNSLLSSSEILSKQPDIYRKDELKINNDGTYKAYEKYNYHISYRVLKLEVRILRIRHTS